MPLRSDEIIEAVIKACDSLHLDGSVTLMTGANGTGKSLLRKLLASRLLGDKKVIHTSMDLRTGMHAGLGGLGVMLRDSDWLATGSNTIHSVQSAVKSVRENYLCIDELETGLGEELLLGLVNWLNENLHKALSGSLGCLVVTHSRLVAEHLKYDHWLSLDGYRSAEAWLRRVPVPINVKAWQQEQNDLFRAIQQRIEEGKST